MEKLYATAFEASFFPYFSERMSVTRKVEATLDELGGKNLLELTKGELKDYAAKLEKEMKAAAKDLQFERAAMLRDRMMEVRAKL